MTDFLPKISKEEYEAVKKSADQEALFSLLSQPLHEKLYEKQDFNYIDELSDSQQLMIVYDYVKMQVLQGGFIQLIQNKYTLLVATLHELLQRVNAADMAQVLDDALKVYVLNRELLDKEYSSEEFAKLYTELKEFEAIDRRFELQCTPTQNEILLYADEHIDEVAELT